MKQDGNIYLKIHVDGLEGELIEAGWYRTIDAINALQSAILQLRNRARSKFDPSFGEQPMALLGPSEEEARQFLTKE